MATARPLDEAHADGDQLHTQHHNDLTHYVNRAVVVDEDEGLTASAARSTLGLGTAAVTNTGTGAANTILGNDSRLSDARAPTAHASTHQPGGSDAMAVDAAAGVGSLRTLGTGTTQAAAGNDARITGAVQASLVDAKGDLLTATAADTPARLAVGADGRVLKASSSAGTGLAWSVDVLSAMYLTNGEEVRPRSVIAGYSFAADSGYVHLSYWVARKTETVNSLLTFSSGQASAGLTLARMGVYSVAGNGDLTLVAACASDTNLWSGLYTGYTRSTISPWSKVAGQMYAFALLAVGATMPAVSGVSMSTISDSAPRETGVLTGQADLPASASAGSVASDYRLFAGYVLP